MSKIVKLNDQDHETQYLSSIDRTVELARNYAYKQVSKAQIVMNCLLGYWLVELQQTGNSRAAYGKELLKSISQTLTERYGNPTKLKK